MYVNTTNAFESQQKHHLNADPQVATFNCFSFILWSHSLDCLNEFIIPFIQGANRMRGRLGSVDGFERTNSLASEKVCAGTLVHSWLWLRKNQHW